MGPQVPFMKTARRILSHELVPDDLQGTKRGRGRRWDAQRLDGEATAYVMHGDVSVEPVRGSRGTLDGKTWIA